MHAAPFLAIALLAATPAAAQDDRHPVSPDSSWSITDSDCSLDAGWDDEVHVTINRHDDHYDLGTYDPRIKDLVPEEIITVRYGTGGDPASAQEHQAVGHQEEKQLSYVSNVDAALLDRIATANSFQLYRGYALLQDLDMDGFAEALAAARACEARNPIPPAFDPAATAEVAAEAAAAMVEEDASAAVPAE